MIWRWVLILEQGAIHRDVARIFRIDQRHQVETGPPPGSSGTRGNIGDEVELPVRSTDLGEDPPSLTLGG